MKLNEIQIIYKRTNHDLPQVTCSKIAYETALKAYSEHNSNLDLKEYFYILLLNRKNVIVSFYKVSEGGVTGTIADTKLIFSTCIKCLCSSVILVHNHPSGNLQPSKEDIDLTNKLLKAGRILDIEVLDHLIITSDKYYSFSDDGLMG
ncbi:MAG: JAB domain-containing protein [Crocinitomicaceae bacterium]|nr:JAB domain-containing protein [Crocinitomicaceae bacterium]